MNTIFLNPVFKWKDSHCWFLLIILVLLFQFSSEPSLKLPKIEEEEEQQFLSFQLHDVAVRKRAILKVGFFYFLFLSTLFNAQRCSICRPSDSIVSKVAGIELRTVATLALTARRSNHLVRSHPLNFNSQVLYSYA
jgi:hypothetical protein